MLGCRGIGFPQHQKGSQQWNKLYYYYCSLLLLLGKTLGLFNTWLFSVVHRYLVLHEVKFFHGSAETVFVFFSLILSWACSKDFQRLHNLWCHNRFSTEAEMKSYPPSTKLVRKRFARMDNTATLLTTVLFGNFYFCLKSVIYVNIYWIYFTILNELIMF